MLVFCADPCWSLDLPFYRTLASSLKEVRVSIIRFIFATRSNIRAFWWWLEHLSLLHWVQVMIAENLRDIFLLHVLFLISCDYRECMSVAK